MNRYTRLDAPGAVVHVVSRFVNREFRLKRPEERAEYLDRVASALLLSDWTPVAYVLMSSHVHWALIAGVRASASFIQPLHSGFARWLNRRQQRLGPLFAGRHSTIICDERHAVRLLAYLHNNPVRGGVVRDAADSTWSSHLDYVGERRPPSWLDVAAGMRLGGFEPSNAGRIAFAEFVGSRRTVPRTVEFSDDALPELRSRCRRVSGAPAEISSQRLVTGAVGRVEIVAGAGTRVRPRWPGNPAALVEAVASQLGIDPVRMSTRDRHRDVTEARRLAIVTWRDFLGRGQGEMSDALGISAPAASHLFRRASLDLRQTASRLGRELWDRAAQTS